MLPEKVEGKLFILTLLICLIASFVTSRFILQTEKNRLIAETKERLENVGRRHISLIEGQLKDREDEGKQAAKSIKAAISSISGESQLSHSTDSDGSITGISPTLACSFFLSSGAELTKELTSRILNTVKAIDLLAPALTQSQLR